MTVGLTREVAEGSQQKGVNRARERTKKHFNDKSQVVFKLHQFGQKSNNITLVRVFSTNNELEVCNSIIINDQMHHFHI